MRAKHTPHSFPAFPVYSSAFLSPDELVLGGGGGTSKSGIKNQIRLYRIEGPANDITLVDQVNLAPGEDAPMSMAASSSGVNPTIVCGINSPEEDVKRGENRNCRVFGVLDSKLGLLSEHSTIPGGEVNIEDYQKVTVISPDSTNVAVASTTALHLLSYPTLAPISTPIDTPTEIWDASFSPTELLLVTGSTLFMYTLPPPLSESNQVTSSPSKKGKKRKSNRPAETITLNMKHTIDVPEELGGKSGSVFRAAKFDPTNPHVMYTISNTIPTRTPGSRKSPSRRGFACRWHLKDAEWKIDKMKKICDKGVTAFDVSSNGQYLAYGGSDYTIGLLDSQTLHPMVHILHAHTLPPTTLNFNPSGTLLVSGSADNSIRIIDVPEHKAGAYSWAFIIFVLLAIIALIVALAASRYLP